MKYNFRLLACSRILGLILLEFIKLLVLILQFLHSKKSLLIVYTLMRHLKSIWRSYFKDLILNIILKIPMVQLISLVVRLNILMMIILIYWRIVEFLRLIWLILVEIILFWKFLFKRRMMRHRLNRLIVKFLNLKNINLNVNHHQLEIQRVFWKICSLLRKIISWFWGISMLKMRKIVRMRASVRMKVIVMMIILKLLPLQLEFMMIFLLSKRLFQVVNMFLTLKIMIMRIIYIVLKRIMKYGFTRKMEASINGLPLYYLILYKEYKQVYTSLDSYLLVLIGKF